MRSVLRGFSHLVVIGSSLLVMATSLRAESVYYFEGPATLDTVEPVCCCNRDTHQCRTVEPDETPFGKSARTKCRDTGIGWDVREQAACSVKTRQ